MYHQGSPIAAQDTHLAPLPSYSSLLDGGASGDLAVSPGLPLCPVDNMFSPPVLYIHTYIGRYIHTHFKTTHMRK